MSAQLILGKAVFTIRGADRLTVDGELVEIQRSGPAGFETVAVAGEDLLVTIEPATCAKVAVDEAETVTVDGLFWRPAGVPLD